MKKPKPISTGKHGHIYEVLDAHSISDIEFGHLRFQKGIYVNSGDYWNLKKAKKFQSWLKEAIKYLENK